MTEPDPEENIDPTDLSTAEKLNLVTGKISWPELQRAFAQGKVILVDNELDLIETATYFVEDSSVEVNGLLQAGRIRRAGTDDARHWNDSNREFWAVVTAPWVLVQEICPSDP